MFLEIKPTKTYCIYWFIPFVNSDEASLDQDGHIENLLEEQAEGITIKLKKHQPKQLIIGSDSELD